MKKIIVVLAILATLLAVCACGNVESTPANETPSVTATPSVPEETKAPEEEVKESVSPVATVTPWKPGSGTVEMEDIPD